VAAQPARTVHRGTKGLQVLHLGPHEASVVPATQLSRYRVL
jgi:hypothetical protein